MVWRGEECPVGPKLVDIVHDEISVSRVPGLLIYSDASFVPLEDFAYVSGERELSTRLGHRRL